MRLQRLFRFETAVGVFYIARSGDGRFHPVFRDESLGSYARDRQAADDLAGGYTFSAPGVETDQLGLPADLSEWERIGR